MRILLLAGIILIGIGNSFGKVISWGDQGDGRYVNPVLNADYSDPDVIRVGDKY